MNPIVAIETLTGIYYLQEGSNYSIEEIREERYKAIEIGFGEGLWCESGPGFTGSRRRIFFNWDQVVAIWPAHS